MKRIGFLLAVLISGTVFCAEPPRLTLDECLRLAVQNNLEVKRRQSIITQAELEKKDTFTLFLPKLTSSFSQTRLDRATEVTMGPTPPLLPEPVTFQATKRDLYNFSINLQQPVFKRGQDIYEYNLAKENLARAQYEYQAALVDLEFEVKQAYFSILKAEHLLSVTLELKKQAEEHLKVVKSFFQQGLATKVDILKTEVFLSEVKQRILEAENTLALARASLNFLLNQPLSGPIEVEDVKADKKEVMCEKWQEQALTRRPELQILTGLKQLADLGVKTARAAYLPQIMISSGYLGEKGTQSSLENWRRSWNIVWTADLDIWNWGSNRYKVERAIAFQEQTRVEYDALKKTVELEVKNACLTLAAAGKRMETAGASIAEAGENLRLNRLLYQEGLATTTDVLDAQTALSQARNNHFQALYDYQVSFARLEKAAGQSSYQGE